MERAVHTVGQTRRVQVAGRLRRFGRGGLLLLAVVLVVLGRPRQGHTQTSEAIRAQVAQTAVTGETKAFYELRDYAPAWLLGKRRLEEAASVADALLAADRHGLSPSDYRANRIRTLLHPGPGTDEAAATLDVLLTDGLMRYGRHQLRGRVDVQRLHPGWQLPQRTLDLAEVVQRSLQADTLDALLARLSPPYAAYDKLRRALARYRNLAERGGWPRVPEGGSLRLGDDDARVLALRKRLQGTADLDTFAAADSARASTFDAALEDAVRGFQQRQGLTVDGIVGPKTQQALNVPVEHRVRQILLNLERWRWMPADLGARYIAVNIPDFSLRVVEDGDSVLSMRVIVGTTGWPTPLFSASITEVVLAPYWNIPSSIVQNEILPKLRRDPTYLQRNEIRRLPSGRLRQDPGPTNPLGQVKFIMPNPHGVLLHDTPSRYLFDRSQCTFSHSCIRLQRPLDLAQYVLREDTTWTRSAMEEAIRTATDVHVPVPETLEVHVLYRTAWVDARGRMHFRRDVYGHDARLSAALGLLD